MVASFSKLALLVSTFACATVLHVSARCDFQLSPPNRYTCGLLDVISRSADDIVDLSGDHLGGRTDADVNEIVITPGALIEEIPSMIFSTFPNLESFFIPDNQLRQVYIPCGPRMNSIRIFNNPLVSIQNGAFPGCSNVSSLTLFLNPFLVSFDDNAFDGLTGLQTFTASQSSFQSIPENLFRPTTQLETISIDQGRLISIQPDAFQTLSNLRDVSIQLSQLESLTTGTFKNKLHLTRINLRVNQIQTIEAGAFDDLPVLQYLNLSDNGLIVLDSSIFSTQMPRLQVLWMPTNQINAIDKNVFDKLPSIQNIYMMNNVCVNEDFILIVSVESDVLPGLQTCIDNFNLF